MNEPEGSFYDSFAGHEAPVQQDTRRKVNWQAAPEPQARHEEIIDPEQKDLSYYAWWRLVAHKQPVSSFEQGVNIEFRKEHLQIDGDNFDAMRDIYIKTYKTMLNN